MGAVPFRAHVGTRTRDLFLTKEVLYRLSYVSVTNRLAEPSEYRYGDSNPCSSLERAVS